MFTKHKKKINRIIKQTMIGMSNHIAEKITDEAVPVRTGRYVKNHVVQTVNPSFPRLAFPKDPPYPDKLTPAESAPIRMPVKTVLKATAKSLINTGNTKIYFGNKMSYAHLIEYVGWSILSERAKTGPYYIFGKAAVSLELNRKKIAYMAKR